MMGRGCDGRTQVGRAPVVWVALAGFTIALSQYGFADESPAKVNATGEPSEEVRTRVSQLDADVATTREQEAALANELRELRAELSDLDRTWKLAEGEMEDSAASSQRLRNALRKQREELKSADTERSAADQAVQKARAELEAARKALTEAEAKLKAAEDKRMALVGPIEGQEAELRATEAKMPELKEQAEEAGERRRVFAQRLFGLEQELTSLVAARRDREQQIESILREAGQWVSFSEQVAPIFQRSCVPCHNARNPQGQYSMQSYTAVVSAAASGPVIEPGDADLSALVQYIEDGWMPYEAERLPDEEIALVRRWIDVGARLDAGVEATESLIRLMPPVPQPLPPEVYPTAVPVTAIAVSADGKVVATSGYHEVLLWDAATHTLLGRLTNVAQRVYGLAFQPGGDSLAVAAGTPGKLGEVKLFRWRDQVLEAALLQGEDAFFDVVWSPDGRRLAAAAADGAVHVVELDSGETQRLPVHADWVQQLAWSADGARIVSASRDKTAKVLSSETGGLLRTFNGHATEVTDVLVGQDGKRVLTVGKDRQLRWWQPESGKQQHSVGGLQREDARMVAMGTEQIAVLENGSAVGLRQWSDGKSIRRVKLPARWALSIAAVPEGARCWVGDESGQVFEVDLEKGELLRSWLASPVVAEMP